MRRDAMGVQARAVPTVIAFPSATTTRTRSPTASAERGIPDPRTELVLERGRVAYAVPDPAPWVAIWKDRFDMSMESRARAAAKAARGADRSAGVRTGDHPIQPADTPAHFTRDEQRKGAAFHRGDQPRPAVGDVRAFVDTVEARTAKTPEKAAETPSRERQPRPPDLLDQLERLGKLHAAGLLTEEEFSEKKAEILERL